MSDSKHVLPTTLRPTPVGIDLGTTYSVVAHLDQDGRPVTVLNHLGDLLTPSAVLFESGEVVVGREAVKASVIEPDGYAECFKRDMGGLKFRRKVRGIEVPPEVLSGFILERLKLDAEKRLGPIQHAVITVPAFFDETRRKATQDAGRLAGLDVLDIINEPTAAAVAYGYQKGLLNPSEGGPGALPQRVLVYDLGGGTFDVTILEINGKEFRAVATDGDVQLGGKDFDERLVNHIAERFVVEHGVDPRSDAEDFAQLWLDAEEAKHALTERQKTSIVCFYAGIRLRMEITRAEFEEWTRDLLERTETTTSLVVKDAGLDWSQIDRVLLVGGSCRMPMVAQMLRHVTGKQPDESLSPDEAVAHGAALYAGMLMQDGGPSSVTRCKLINVNSHSLGVVGLDKSAGKRVNTILIPKNTPLPHRAVRLFATAKADQHNVMVPIVEGESHRPDECISLGRCVVRDLPAGLPAGTEVHVEYQYAANGRISVSARVPATRQSAHVEIEREGKGTLDSLDQWRKRLLGQESGTGIATREDAPVDLNDRASVIRRLDFLYAKVGRAALKLDLPEPLARGQRAARAAATALSIAEKTLAQVRSLANSVGGRAEKIQFAADLARAETELQQAQNQAQFTCLVLGRECIDQNHQDSVLANQSDQIRQLRARLS